MPNTRHYSILVDADRCIGCYTCEVSCKQEHDLTGGYSWIKMVDTGAKAKGDKLKRDLVPTVCLHCGNPSCQDICPNDAIIKNENGVVFIKEELCDGCKLCLTVCPVSALQYNTEKEIAEKCNLCLPLINDGLAPACVNNCPTGALCFGETNDVINSIREKKIKSLFSQKNQVFYGVSSE
jgi:Fe-S-cluster-containing dehydrogenase component